MKIQITESDLRTMVSQCVNKLLYEREIYRHDSKHGDYIDYDGDIPDDDNEEEGDTYEVNALLGNSAIPGSDGRFFDITFKVDADGNVLSYTCNGDTNQKIKMGYTCPKWLDKQIMDWANSPEGQAYIEDNMF